MHDQPLTLYKAGPKVVAKILCDLSNTIEFQQEQIKALEVKVAKLSKNSFNSSKPPSSDDNTKPKSNKKNKGKRRIDGQSGHQRHERPLFFNARIRCLRNIKGCGRIQLKSDVGNTRNTGL